MLELNKVMVVGRLTQDPEVRYLNSGDAVANFDIAVNRRRRNPQTSEYSDETSFFSVTAWRRQAEFVERFMSKGKAIYIEGRLQQDTWEAQDGSKRSRVVIIGERLQFAESRAEEQARQDGAPPSGGGGGAPRRPSRGEQNGPPQQQQAPPPDDSTDDDLPF